MCSIPKEVLRCTLMASCLVHLSCMFKCTIVITHYPLSVRRRKLLTFSTHLCNCWTEFNETSQEARSQRPLPSLCFSGRSETQDDRTVLWFTYTFSTSSLLPVNRIRQNLTGSKNLTSFTKFVFFGRSENRDGSLVLWLTKTFSLNVSNGLWQNLTGSNQRGPYQYLLYFRPRYTLPDQGPLIADPSICQERETGVDRLSGVKGALVVLTYFLGMSMLSCMIKFEIDIEGFLRYSQNGLDLVLKPRDHP